MTRVFFIGGPADREWRTVDDYSLKFGKWAHEDRYKPEPIDYTTDTYIRKMIGNVEIAYHSDLTLEDAIMTLINAYEEH